MKFFFLPLIAGLIGIAALNIGIDPSSRWWRSQFNFTRQWQLDEVWVAPLRIEERYFRKRHIPMLDEIDLLGLGSSRFMNIETNMFASRPRFYNASVSGATIWDYVAMWEAVKQRGLHPKHLLLYVDSWNLNRNTYLRYRWIANAPLVTDFLREVEDANMTHARLQSTAFVDWVAGWFYEWADLFSPAVLKVSLQELANLWRQAEIKTNYIAPMADYPTDFPAWKADGSLLMTADAVKPKTAQALAEIGRNIGLGGMYVYMMDWQTDTDAIQLLDYVIEDAASRQIDVLIVQPPFQQVTYDIIHRRGEYQSIPTIYANTMRELQQRHANLRYCDALDPATAHCGETEFIDASHASKDCSRKVIAYCMQRVPEWQY